MVAPFLVTTNNTSWTDLQDVVPARASISLRTPCATADALASRLLSPSFRHSPFCDSRSTLSPLLILSFVYERKVKEFFCYFQVFCRFFDPKDITFQINLYLCPRFGEKSGLIESIRYYFAFSQKRRKLIGNKNATR